jgi:hypothetical protein
MVLRVWLKLCARFGVCLVKHALQYTGLPGVGLKETVVVSPQSEHLTSNIFLCVITITPDYIEHEKVSFQLSRENKANGWFKGLHQ